jgi:capsular polysaccharide transport system ATP-binding protein
MITVSNLTKKYHTRKGLVTILDDINVQIAPGEKVGILGRNGAGKSTLIRLLSGFERPTAGNIQREMTLSWPLAFTGGFHQGLTGFDNLRFICRIYNVVPEEKIQFVQEFSDLGPYLKEKVVTYSSGMQARLAFALSMAIDFDCFLIDEIVAVGDSRFHEKCHQELFEKRKDRAMVIVSHDGNYIRTYCQKAAVLVKGKLTSFDNMDEAFDYYNAHSHE